MKLDKSVILEKYDGISLNSENEIDEQMLDYLSIKGDERYVLVPVISIYEDDSLKGVTLRKIPISKLEDTRLRNL